MNKQPKDKGIPMTEAQKWFAGLPNKMKFPSVSEYKPMTEAEKWFAKVREHQKKKTHI